MNEERMRELANDKAFMEMVLGLETPEEVQDAFAEKDVDLSIAEIQKVYELLSEHAGEELTEEDLEQVAGGEIISALIITGLILFGAAAGGSGAYFGTTAALRRRW